MTQRRFMASIDTIARDLAATLARMGADSARIESGGHLTQVATRHLSRSAVATAGRVPELLPSAARLSFARDGKPYVFTCRTYAHPLDNLRAVQRAATLLWAIFDDYGVGAGDGAAFDTLFGAASEALARVALGDGIRPWWQVLGIPSDADGKLVTAAFHSLARKHHPDVGGSPDEFKRINRAYEEGIAAARNGAISLSGMGK